MFMTRYRHCQSFNLESCKIKSVLHNLSLLRNTKDALSTWSGNVNGMKFNQRTNTFVGSFIYFIYSLIAIDEDRF